MIKKKRLSAHKRLQWQFYIKLILLTGGLSGPAYASEHNRYLQYQQAANYTHLKWQNQTRPKVKVALSQLKNYSGIPMEYREEAAEYFYHGKLPGVLNSIVADAFRASRYFAVNQSHADYRIELILDEYRLPFAYAPDDTWWQKLHDQADRWLQTPPSTHVKLTMKLLSADKKIKTWMDSVEIELSNCDLNLFPQPATQINNRNQMTRNYLSTTPGQSFLAATNFLILKAIQRLHQQAPLATVESRFGSEIALYSENANFTVGDILNVYPNHPQKGKSAVSAGQIKIISSNQNRAMAYPINMRADNIVENDWVGLPSLPNFPIPGSLFETTKNCAEVITAEAD